MCAGLSLVAKDIDVSIFAKKKRLGVMVGLILWPGLAAAQALTCVAEVQCRGDAERMCAPSSLSIVAETRGAGVDMWIDRQGPYRADLSQGADGQRLTLPLFKRHEMVVAADGAFLYRGNRGKRYTGHCEGAL